MIATLMQAATLGGVTMAAMTAGAYFLPRYVHVNRSAIIEASPEDILAIASSNEGYQRFNPYKNTDPELKINLFGPTSGVGSGFEFQGKEGKGSQVVTKVTAESVEFLIDLGPMGKPTQTMSVVRKGNGSEITWTMEADMGMNPAARIFGLFMDGMIGKTFETGFANLAKLNFN